MSIGHPTKLKKIIKKKYYKIIKINLLNAETIVQDITIVCYVTMNLFAQNVKRSSWILLLEDVLMTVMNKIPTKFFYFIYFFK